MISFFCRLFATVTFCLSLSVAAIADTSTFTWQGTLQYDPDKIVLIGGDTLGDLFDKLGVGDASTGEASISGTVRYAELTEAETSNQFAAGFPQSILSANIQIGDHETDADIEMIKTNAATSRVGMLTHPDGGFCGDADHCEPYGVRPPGWGNQIATLNDAGHVMIDETGGNPSSGDLLAFMMGRTDAEGEFSPPMVTATGDDIFVDGLSILMFSKPDVQLLNELTIPSIKDVSFEDMVGKTEIWLFLEGPELFQTVRVEGVLTQVTELIE